MECHTPTHQEWAEITAHIIRRANDHTEPVPALVGGVIAMIRLRNMTENGEYVAYCPAKGQAPGFRQTAKPLRDITLSELTA